MPSSTDRPDGPTIREVTTITEVHRIGHVHLFLFVAVLALVMGLGLMYVSYQNRLLHVLIHELKRISDGT